MLPEWQSGPDELKGFRMHRTERRYETGTQTSLLAGVLLMAVTVQLCQAVDSFPPLVKAAIERVRDTRAGMYDSVESSTLGRIASPTEFAATQRNLRRHYTAADTTLRRRRDSSCRMPAGSSLAPFTAGCPSSAVRVPASHLRSASQGRT